MYSKLVYLVFGYPLYQAQQACYDEHKMQHVHAHLILIGLFMYEQYHGVELILCLHHYGGACHPLLQ